MQPITRPSALLAAAAAAAALLLLSLGTVEGFHAPSQGLSAAASSSSSSRRARGRVAMEANSAVSSSPLGQGPYKGPASNPLLDSVRYPHDMKQFNLKVRACMWGFVGFPGCVGSYTTCRTPSRLTAHPHPQPRDRTNERQELKQLAHELRWDTLNSVSKTGGHLGSSLGVIELTVALHYVFNTPDDRVIWDVSHQVRNDKGTD